MHGISHYILWLQNDIVEGILFHVVILSMIIGNLDMNTEDKNKQNAGWALLTVNIFLKLSTPHDWSSNSIQNQYNTTSIEVVVWNESQVY